MKKITILLIILSCLSTVQASTYSGGSGEPNDPYKIATAQDLIDLGNEPNDYNKNFILISDIDMDPNVTGIAAYTTAVIEEFTGVFDGNGYTISNLNINGGYNENYLGLFGFIDGAIIKNLDLESVVITGESFIGGLVGRNYGTIINCYATGSVTGDESIGGLVGFNGGIISKCYVNASINGWDSCTGGLVGMNEGYILSCYSTSSVEGSECTGGLVGGNDGSISNCYSTGSVNGSEFVGGLVGANIFTIGISTSVPVSITNCFSTGAVSGTEYVGGLIGYPGEDDISNCFWDIETSGQSESEIAGGTGLTTEQMMLQETFTSAGWDFVGESDNGTSQIWQMSIETGYPVLSIFNGYTPVVLSGDGSQNSPYLINDANDLGALYYHYDNNSYYKLTSNIDLNDIQWSSAIIPVFNGIFDGNDFVIQDMNIIGNCHSGLFGMVDINAVVINLGQENVFISGTGSVGSISVRNHGTIENCYMTGEVNGGFGGGLVGTNFGSIMNCYANVTINGGWSLGGLVGSNSGIIEYCNSAGSVNGEYYVGGLVGRSGSHYIDTGSIVNCYSSCFVYGYGYIGGLAGQIISGSVTSCSATSEVEGNISYVHHAGGLVGGNSGIISNCYSTGSVDGDDYIGGLAGENWEGSITNCYSNGSANGNYEIGGLVGYQYQGNISYCFSTGFVNGSEYFGGLVGLDEDGSITKCFWDIQTSGQSTSDGGTGKTTSQMQDINTYLDEGWDFVGETDNGIEDFWFMPEDDYPHLSWEID